MKYSKEQLKAMAITLQEARITGTGNYLKFLMHVATLTGVSVGFVQQKIAEYSKY